MRFNVKEKIVPLVGDTRAFEKFLLFPRRIGNQIVWLETVIAKQKYIKYEMMIPEVGPVDSTKWGTVSYELIESNDIRGYASKH